MYIIYIFAGSGFEAFFWSLQNLSSQSLCVEVNEQPFQFKREKRVYQLPIKIAANPNSPVYEIEVEGQELFQLLVCVLKSLDDLDFSPNANNIAKFQFPETPPRTYLTPMVNLTLSHATKDQTDLSTSISLHDEVNDSS